MSLFSSEGEKISILNNDKKIIDIFWVCSLGFLCLKKIAPHSSPLDSYLNKKYMINKVNLEKSDDYSDLVISIKLLYEAEIISSTTWLQFINYLSDLKKSNYNNPDFNKFFNLVGKIPMSKISPNSMIIGDIKRFMKGSIEEEDLLVKLYEYNLKFDISYDFFRYSTLLRSYFYGED